MCYVCPSWTVSFPPHFIPLWSGDSPHLDLCFKNIRLFYLFIYLCLESKNKTPLASPLWNVVVLVFGPLPVFTSIVPTLSQGHLGIICMAYFLHGVWLIPTSRHLSCKHFPWSGLPVGKAQWADPLNTWFLGLGLGLSLRPQHVGSCSKWSNSTLVPHKCPLKYSHFTTVPKLKINK